MRLYHINGVIVHSIYEESSFPTQIDEERFSVYNVDQMKESTKELCYVLSLYGNPRRVDKNGNPRFFITDNGNGILDDRATDPEGWEEDIEDLI